jgi:predicted PurR-regulated permease PerM
MHYPLDSRPATRVEYRALGIVAVIAALTFVRVALPLGAGLFLGALVAFTLYPSYQRLTRWTGRPGLAAFLCAFFAWLFVAGGIGGIVYLLIDRGAALSQQMPNALAEGGPVDHSATQVSNKLGDYGIHSPSIDHHLHHALEELEGYAGSLAGKAATAAFGLMLTMFFMVITVHFVLRHWSRLGHWAEALLPLRPRHTRKVVRQLRSLGREAMLGTLFLGLVQGSLAGLGYAVAGAPDAAFFGAMTALASTLPALGTFLVWAPIGAYLIGSGHVVAGSLELAWGFFVVVMFSDGFLRPKVVGRGSKMGMLPTLIGLFGGLELFGFIGLLLGPTLVGVALAILRLYARERAAQQRLQRRRSTVPLTPRPDDAVS